MASKTISLGFKIETGSNGLKQLTVDADGLRKVMGAAVSEADRMSKAIQKSANIGMIISDGVNAFNALQGAMGQLVGAYQTQMEAETKLANNMRNTMDATDAQVKRIKELCAAQQERGVSFSCMTTQWVKTTMCSVVYDGTNPRSLTEPPKGGSCGVKHFQYFYPTFTMS